QLPVANDRFTLTNRAPTPSARARLPTLNLPPDKRERGTPLLDSDIVPEVWIHGSDSGLVSPTILRLTGGEHTIQLRDADEPKSATARVRIKVGRATQLSLKGGRG